MNVVVMSVRDSASGLYAAPFYVSAVGLAVRDFTDEVNRADRDNKLYLHPGDYELFHLGVFDNTAGRFDLFQDPKPICSGNSVKVSLN